jgi:ABC-2 type transport system permease protein
MAGMIPLHDPSDPPDPLDAFDSKPGSRGPLGRNARAQYSAILTLRWRLLVNSLRSTQGVFEFGAKAFAVLVYFSLGFMMAVGFGFGSYAMASNHALHALLYLFWAVFFMWQGFPILLASFQQQFDRSILLRFPIRFDSFVLLSLLFGISDLSTIFGSLCLLGIWVGVSVAIPSLALYLALAVFLFGLFNLLLARAIFSWVDRWLAQRRTREIVTALFFVAMLGLQVMNPAWRSQQNKNGPTAADFKHAIPSWVLNLTKYQQWLPPGAIAHAVITAAPVRPASDDQESVLAPHAEPLRLLQSVPWLGLFGAYTLTIGSILLIRLRAEFRGENLSESAALKKSKVKAATLTASTSANNTGVVNQGSTAQPASNLGPIVAIMQKEFHILFRSIPLLYSIGAPLLYAVLIAGKIFTGSHSATSSSQLALPCCIAFTMLGFTTLFSNTLGTEGAGIQLYYLSPTPLRMVFLAKNLFYGALLLLDVLVIGTLVSLRLGTPSSDAILVTIAWFLFALPTYLALGNIYSLQMPYRMNLGRIGRRGQGSQANAWLSLLSQLLVNGVGAAILIPALLTNHLWLAAPALLVLAFCAFIAWYSGLNRAEKSAYKRMDNIIGTLARTE